MWYKVRRARSAEVNISKTWVTESLQEKGVGLSGLGTPSGKDRFKEQRPKGRESGTHYAGAEGWEAMAEKKRENSKTETDVRQRGRRSWGWVTKREEGKKRWKKGTGGGA